jgi:DNA-binding NarL/FixJ family response regulator
MSNVIFVSDNNLFGQSLKAFLERELENSNVIFVNSVSDIECENHKSDLVIYDLPVSYNISTILHYQQINPSAKVLVIHNCIPIGEFNKLINSGIKGSILYSAPLHELVRALKMIESDQTSFPQQLLQEVMFQKSVSSAKSANVLSDREVEILKMLCDGLSNEQISDKLHLSYDTVKWHRSNIFIKCECKNVLALYKFAIKHNLVQPTNV